MLTDGNDTVYSNINQLVKALLEKEFQRKTSAKLSLTQNCEQTLQCSINTFGYGDDFDSELLYMISQKSEGNFCYIKDYQSIS